MENSTLKKFVEAAFEDYLVNKDKTEKSHNNKKSEKKKLEPKDELLRLANFGLVQASDALERATKELSEEDFNDFAKTLLSGSDKFNPIIEFLARVKDSYVNQEESNPA